MSDSQATAVTGEFVPVQAAERIHALDIVRGFALIGIFLMNVEWFSRPISELGTGVDMRLTGMDYAASWFIYTFVQGKFWTMFSLLFGMGFAVMLGRAETTERSFILPYVRRIVGLFLFGSAHYIMVWTGDILHNYAVTAIFLLLISTNSWKTTVGLFLSFVATAGFVQFKFGEEAVQPFGLMCAMFGLTTLLVVFLNTKNARRASAIFTGLLMVGVVAAYFISKAFGLVPMAAMLVGCLVLGGITYLLSKREESRYWKWGVFLYSLPFLIGTLVLAGQAAKDYMPAAPQAQSATQGEAKPGADASPAAIAASKASEDEAKAKKDQEEQRAKRKAERAEETKRLVALYTKGSYWESIVYRAKEYSEDMKFAAGLSALALPMFLIGFWFVRSGVIGNIQEHLPLFRKLAMVSLPIGLAMTLTAVSLHSSFLDVDWTKTSPRLAQTLFQWGMMPQCIGYVALLICLIYTDLGRKILSPLRYAGQMALTNYISANAIGMWYFSGYGLGQWGHVSRAWQVVFVAVVFGLQLLFSMWWLSKFRYGPLEWVWRAITYWQLPPLRRAVAA